MAVRIVRIGPPWWAWLLISLAVSLILLFLSPVCSFSPEGDDCTTLGMIVIRNIF